MYRDARKHDDRTSRRRLSARSCRRLASIAGATACLLPTAAWPRSQAIMTMSRSRRGSSSCCSSSCCCTARVGANLAGQETPSWSNTHPFARCCASSANFAVIRQSGLAENVRIRRDEKPLRSICCCCNAGRCANLASQVSAPRELSVFSRCSMPALPSTSDWICNK